MTDKNPIVSVQGLSFARADKPIFTDFNLLIPRGKVTVIMGPSGCGKTTLLRLIGGALRPDMGTVTVNGQFIHSLSRQQLYVARRTMGMMFQSSALFTNISVYDNVAFPLREHTQLPEAMIRTLVLMKLEAVGLRGARHLLPGELSGGMARRVALARAIALDPQLIMYDEPFTGLDPVSLAVVVKLIRELNDALGMSSIIVSHHLHEGAAIADYMCVINHGGLIGEGEPQDILHSDNPEVRQFMQGKPDGAIPFHYPARNYAEDLLQ
jgi:phospholipid/cholesterol/gamma-HCH transport system ATP-binding protein